MIEVLGGGDPGLGLGLGVVALLTSLQPSN